MAPHFNSVENKRLENQYRKRDVKYLSKTLISLRVPRRPKKKCQKLTAFIGNCLENDSWAAFLLRGKLTLPRCWAILTAPMHTVQTPQATWEPTTKIFVQKYGRCPFWMVNGEPFFHISDQLTGKTFSDFPLLLNRPS